LYEEKKEHGKIPTKLLRQTTSSREKKRLSLWEKGLGGSPNQVPQGTSFWSKRGLSLKNPCAT
jgi:hypothetical protein